MSDSVSRLTITVDLSVGATMVCSPAYDADISLMTCFFVYSRSLMTPLISNRGMSINNEMSATNEILVVVRFVDDVCF